jgi:predicted  nucleic acid-binding Zn-ribbon protein
MGEPLNLRESSSESASDEPMEQTRSDLRRMRLQIERNQERYEAHMRRTMALWVLVVLLAFTMAGAWWYGFPISGEQQALTTQVSSFQSAMNSVGERIGAAEAAMASWSSERTGLADQMAALEKTVAANLQLARNQARTAGEHVSQLGQRLREEFANSLSSIQSRIAGIESAQSESGRQVAQLQNEVAGLQREMASMRQETAGEIEQVRRSTESEITGLDRQLASNRTRLDAVTTHVSRERIDFEISSQRSEQVIPGIYVAIQNTNVGKQLVNGWVQIAGEGRTVWIHEHGIQQPLSFVTRSENRGHELVFTRVTRSGVAGYMLVPGNGPSPVAN